MEPTKDLLSSLVSLEEREQQRLALELFCRTPGQEEGVHNQGTKELGRSDVIGIERKGAGKRTEDPQIGWICSVHLMVFLEFDEYE